MNNYAIIYNIENLLDIHEVCFLQNIQQFTQNPSRFVETGFVLDSSELDFVKDKNGTVNTEKTHVTTNWRNTLSF